MSDADAEGEAEPVGDTTVRRPRVPARREPAAMVAPSGAEPDATGDTIVVRRGIRRRPVADTSDRVVGDDARPTSGNASSIAAYGSRAAAPVRGSRRARAAGESDSRPEAAFDVAIPDTEAIARRVRAGARRRLLALALAIVILVVALVSILALLLFAVGV